MNLLELISSYSPEVKIRCDIYIIISKTACDLLVLPRTINKQRFKNKKIITIIHPDAFEIGLRIMAYLIIQGGIRPIDQVKIILKQNKTIGFTTNRLLDAGVLRSFDAKEEIPAILHIF